MRLYAWRTQIEDLPGGLVDRLRTGQPEARAQLFRLYAPQVRRILFLQGLCEEVDDAVQEVFIKVFRAKPPAEETFLAWFYTVILNTGRDLGRRRKTRKDLLERLTEAASALPAAADAGDLPRTADPRLHAALAALAPDFREVVALRFFADLSLEQIARCQDVPLGTVKSRLHGALARLRATLTTQEIDGD